MRRSFLPLLLAIIAVTASAQTGATVGAGRGATGAPAAGMGSQSAGAVAAPAGTQPATPTTGLQQALPGPGTGTQPQLALPGAGVAGQANTFNAQPSNVGSNPGGILLTTPSVSLGTPQAGAAGLQTPTMTFDQTSGVSPVGASAATAGLLPGATNSTVANYPDVLSAIDSRPRGVLPFDRGAGDFSSVYDVAAAQDDRPVAEIARTYKTNRPQVARVITNADIARLNQEPGLAVPGGVSGNAVGAGTSQQPMAQTSPMSGMTSPAEPQTTAPTQAGVAAETTPEPPVQMAQNTPPANEPAPPNQSSAAAQNQNAPAEKASASRLPSTGTALPILAVMGLLAGVAGIIARR
jgi:hypothetical protein